MLGAFDAGSANVLWYRALPALRSDLARWGNASLVGLATVADGIYAATGRISDAGTGGVPTLFGTFQYAPLPDALFASGYE